MLCPRILGGRCISYAPERRGQKISETAILLNTEAPPSEHN